MTKESLHSIIAVLVLICVGLIIYIFSQNNPDSSCQNNYNELYKFAEEQKQALEESNKTINELEQLNEKMISNMELISQYVSSYRVPSYPRHIDCSQTYLGGITCNSY